MTKFKFKRGQIIRSCVDYYPFGQCVLKQDKTYVVNQRKRTTFGHCYIQVIGEDGSPIWYTQDNFRR